MVLLNNNLSSTATVKEVVFTPQSKKYKHGTGCLGLIKRATTFSVFKWRKDCWL